jgi:protein-disulfide isomerase
MIDLLSVAVSPLDHLRGPETAAVSLVEYADFACPFCAAAYPVVRELLLHYRTSLKLVFRHNPRGELHEGANLAARGAEAAARQGRFWAMHDLLFERGAPSGEAELAGYAALLDLDVERFRRDLASYEVGERVRADERSGLRSGVIGTPTFFINGYRFNDKPDLETLFKAVGTTLLLSRLDASAPAPLRVVRRMRRLDG